MLISEYLLDHNGRALRVVRQEDGSLAITIDGWSVGWQEADSLVREARAAGWPNFGPPWQCGRKQPHEGHFWDNGRVYSCSGYARPEDSRVYREQ